MRAPVTPTHLGQYELLRPIGSGGMGTVFEAVHCTLGRRAAVKLLHERDAATQDQIARFLREGRAAAQVRHPHVVDVFDFGVDQGVPYLVMELVQGETLAQQLERDGAMPLPAVVELMLPVVSAVAELHAAGVVHRDLKPANILLARERGGDVCPKVADFGVSRMSDEAREATASNAIVGTFAYMAPEQGRSSRAATERSDLYALGAILYECATGVKPYDASSLYDLLHAIMSAPLVPASTHAPELPPAFDALVGKALQREPEDRFSCAEELGEALLAFAAPRVQTRWASEFQAPRSRDPGASVPPMTSRRGESLSPGPTRRVGLAALAVAAALIAASILARPRASAPVVAGSPSPSAQPPAAAEAPALVPPSPVATSSDAPPPASVSPRSLVRHRPPAAPASCAAKQRPAGSAAVDNGAPILDP